LYGAPALPVGFPGGQVVVLVAPVLLVRVLVANGREEHHRGLAQALAIAAPAALGGSLVDAHALPIAEEALLPQPTHPVVPVPRPPQRRLAPPPLALLLRLTVARVLHALGQRGVEALDGAREGLRGAALQGEAHIAQARHHKVARRVERHAEVVA